MSKRKRTMFKGRKRRIPGKMNSLETKFSEFLESEKRDGVIEWWRYEPFRFKLTDRDSKTTYTPDFAALFPSGVMVLYETKGRWTSASRIKTKLVADQYDMFKVIGVQWKAKDWVFEEFN